MSTIPSPTELYALAFIPGCWYCPKCGFVLTKKAFRVETGEVGTGEKERQSEPCPNDGVWLEPYSYKMQADGLFERLVEHKAVVKEFLVELHATMIDPLADGEIRIEDLLPILLAAARTQRQSLNDIPRYSKGRNKQHAINPQEEDHQTKP